MKIQILETSEILEHSKSSPGWEERYTQMSPGNFHGRLLRIETKELTIYEEKVNCRVEQEFKSPNDAVVLSFDMNEDTLYFISQDGTNSWITPHNYHEVAVVIKSEFLNMSLTGDFDSKLIEIRSFSSKAYATLISGMLRQAINGRNELDKPGVAQEIIDGCSILLGSANHSEKKHLEKNHHKAIIEQVKMCIQSNSLDHIRIANLCSLTGTSARVIRAAFQEYAGMSPLTWVRYRKLNEARSDLLAADYSETTVAEIAMRWSFWHLGRFSQMYRSVFGEYPCSTLRR